MMLEPLAGGSAGSSSVVEGPHEWECAEIERAFQVASAAMLDPEQFRAEARALLNHLPVTQLVDPALVSSIDDLFDTT